MADLIHARPESDVTTPEQSAPVCTTDGVEPAEQGEELVERLVALGVSRTTSEELVDEHPLSQVVDALDAVDVLDEENVRRPAGWVVAAVREGWDLTDVLAERREQQARERHWRRQQEERDRRDAEHAEREARAAGWCAAISEALDDCYLELAIARVTEPVGALSRRSVPVTRAQILGWAIAASDRHPHLVLSDALEQELETGSTPAASLRGELPLPPPSRDGTDDLAERIATALEVRPDLARPPREPEPRRRGAERDAGASIEL